MRAFVRRDPRWKKNFPETFCHPPICTGLLQFARAAAKTTLATERFLSVNHSPLSSGTFARVCLLVERTDGALAGDDALKKLTDRVSSGRPYCIAYGSRMSHVTMYWVERKVLEIQGQQFFFFFFAFCIVFYSSRR